MGARRAPAARPLPTGAWAGHQLDVSRLRPAGLDRGHAHPIDAVSGGEDAHEGYGSRQRRCRAVLGRHRCQEGHRRSGALRRHRELGRADDAPGRDWAHGTGGDDLGSGAGRSPVTGDHRRQDQRLGDYRDVGRNPRRQVACHARGCDEPQGPGRSRERGAGHPRTFGAGGGRRDGESVGRLPAQPHCPADSRDEHDLRVDQGARCADGRAK